MYLYCSCVAEMSLMFRSKKNFSLRPRRKKEWNKDSLFFNFGNKMNLFTSENLVNTFLSSLESFPTKRGWRKGKCVISLHCKKLQLISNLLLTAEYLQDFIWKKKNIHAWISFYGGYLHDLLVRLFVNKLYRDKFLNE